jgi:hypothetical protein
MKTTRLLFVLLPLLGYAGQTAGAAERALVIDRAQSRVEIEVKATVDSFTGKLDAYEARVALDEAGEGVTGEVCDDGEARVDAGLLREQLERFSAASRASRAAAEAVRRDCRGTVWGWRFAGASLSCTEEAYGR